MPRGLFLTDPALPKCTVPGGHLPSLWCLFTEEEMFCFLLHCLFLQAEPDFPEAEMLRGSPTLHHMDRSPRANGSTVER